MLVPKQSRVEILFGLYLVVQLCVHLGPSVAYAHRCFLHGCFSCFGVGCPFWMAYLKSPLLYKPSGICYLGILPWTMCFQKIVTIFILCDYQCDSSSKTSKQELISDQIIISYMKMNLVVVLHFLIFC